MEGEKQKLDINFNIKPTGEIHYHGSGSESWEIDESIREVGRISRRLQEISREAELKTHLLALGFLLILTMTTSFFISRVVSTMFQGRQENVPTVQR